jgi:hypothetical protein
MDALPDACTENGRKSHGSAGDPRVGAFFKLVRGLSRLELTMHIKEILKENTHSFIVDAFVLWAQTRDVRNGKGERNLAAWWLIKLSSLYPKTVTEILPLIPEYGSWKDAVLLLEDTKLEPSVRKALLCLFAKQLLEDKDSKRPSLAAKWAPREKCAHASLAKELAHATFPEEKHPKPLYRKLLSSITSMIDVPETKMCAGSWSEIKPSEVPARCLGTKRRAFLNLKGKADEQRSGKRDRIECAENFEAHAKLCISDPEKAKMHGKVQHPHEMVTAYLKGYGSIQVDPIIEAQWTDLRTRLRNEGALGKLIPLVDVSGSMSGTPMEVAIALGILISEVTHPSIRDRFLTFSSDPVWHVLRPGWSLANKVESARKAKWGMSTDFSKALRMILEVCVCAKVSPEEVSQMQLVVLSDMQFDAARVKDGSPEWETQHEELCRLFKKANPEYVVPRVIFWNLRGDTRDFPVQSDTPGVDLVSGFSPNLLKLFMSGEKPQDPWSTLRKALDTERYDAVRRACARAQENALEGYEF